MRLGFENPVLLFTGVFLFLLFLFISRFVRRNFFISVPLGPPGGKAFAPPVSVGWLVKLLKFLDYAAVFGFILTLSGPVLVSVEPVWLSGGAEVLFVLDISPSMAALDMDGRSRFDAARDMIREFSENRSGDAIGLVVLGKEAALLVPPTVDRSALYSRLESVHIGELGDGTALGTGLALGAIHTGNSRSPRRAVVLITDGENNSGSINPETAALALAGTSLWVIGVGSSGMVPIDYVDNETKMRRTGTFDSRFDPESLRAIARAGNGTYLSAPQKDAFAAAFKQLDDGEMVIRRSGAAKRVFPLSRSCIAAAFILSLFSRFVRRYVLGALI